MLTASKETLESKEISKSEKYLKSLVPRYESKMDEMNKIINEFKKKGGQLGYGWILKCLREIKMVGVFYFGECSP